VEKCIVVTIISIIEAFEQQRLFCPTLVAWYSFLLNQALSTSLHFEEFDVIEEINITMVGISGDESNGYRC
jgi:hypothetical protein